MYVNKQFDANQTVTSKSVPCATNVGCVND